MKRHIRRSITAVAVTTLVAAALGSPARAAQGGGSAALPADSSAQDIQVATGPSGDATKALADSLGTTHTAGVYFDPANQRMAIAVTDEATAQKVRDAGAEARVVRYDTAYLSAIQQKLDTDFTTPGTVWGIDIATNKVVVEADSIVSDANYQALRNAIAPYGDAAQIRRMSGTLGPAATIYGGNYIQSPKFLDAGGVECTLGFSVRSKADPSVTGFLTAGHCTLDAFEEGNTFWYDGGDRFIGATAGRFYPGHDFGWVRKGANSDDTLNGGVIKQNGDIQDINHSRDAMFQEPVCTYGSVSGGACGPVLRTNDTMTYDDGATVHDLDRVDVCRHNGDSGGPLYHSNAALGILSATATNGDCFSWYQPVNAALAWYGLEVY